MPQKTQRGRWRAKSAMPLQCRCLLFFLMFIITTLRNIDLQSYDSSLWRGFFRFPSAFGLFGGPHLIHAAMIYLGRFSGLWWLATCGW